MKKKKPVVRNYKDTVFRMLFKDKERLLGLYNAVSGKQYTDIDKFPTCRYGSCNMLPVSMKS